jgi:hypothetical protein
MSNDNKFKNGKIYTIRNRNDETLIYVGSTVQPLYKRLSAHKISSKNPKKENYLLYIKMNETDMNDWYIELYIDCPCERKEQVTQREGEVIRQIGTLNKNIPGRTHKEWREENKEHIKEHTKEYREANKDKYFECTKDYRESNKDIIKEKLRNYYLANKKKIKEKNKIYNETNKGIIKEKCHNYYIKNKLEKEEANIIIS